MRKYYYKMKDQVKVIEALESSGTDDESSLALKKLRPDQVKEHSETKGVRLKFRDFID